MRSGGASLVVEMADGLLEAVDDGMAYLGEVAIAEVAIELFHAAAHFDPGMLPGHDLEYALFVLYVLNDVRRMTQGELHLVTGH